MKIFGRSWTKWNTGPKAEYGFLHFFPPIYFAFFFFLQLHKLNGQNVFYTVFPAFQIKNQLQNNNFKIFT